MTDRDYFAAAALSGMLADGRSTWGTGSREDYCRIAYEWADDMVRERERSSIFRTALGAACAPHADGGGDTPRCPDAPPDVTQPDNGLATSGRGPCYLTSAEREAVSAGLGAIEALYADGAPIGRPIHDTYAPTLRLLLARTARKLSENDSFQLTDDEREAMAVAVEYVGSAYAVQHHAETLRGLLKRLT